MQCKLEHFSYGYWLVLIWYSWTIDGVEGVLAVGAARSVKERGVVASIGLLQADIEINDHERITGEERSYP